MAGTEPGIIYDPLKSRTEIRLLLLLAHRSGDDPIQCFLLNSNRDEEYYQALSYEWGTESKDDPIIMINDYPVQIRKNLHAAMEQIRIAANGENLNLWIDALCIDQGNHDEMSQQIGLMGEIFGNANCIIAWLGVAKDNSDVAMEWMADKRLDEKLMSSTSDDTERKAIASLCNRSYWRRVWIVQELYLAREYVVQCGSKIIPCEQFESSLASLNTVKPEDWKEIVNNPADEHRRGRQRGTMISSGKQYNTLRRWLAACINGGFQCSKEHDLIYGLLGVSDDCKNGKIVADYKKPLRDLYLEALAVNPGSWRATQRYLIPFAKRMKLEITSDLKGSIEKVLGWTPDPVDDIRKDL